ncbi:hypothetical protein L2E82_05198 [Cichorium intybus]|uniref:Uncharacterized protein n=1 Tax=Cichorium intybus TaxID=13427 RepID=A0ACB9H6P7_CICIN|nr:hypothetical protein L2E82_05198 [Cichorium intybus]
MLRSTPQTNIDATFSSQFLYFPGSRLCVFMCISSLPLTASHPSLYYFSIQLYFRAELSSSTKADEHISGSPTSPTMANAAAVPPPIANRNTH